MVRSIRCRYCETITAPWRCAGAAGQRGPGAGPQRECAHAQGALREVQMMHRTLVMGLAACGQQADIPATVPGRRHRVTAQNSAHNVGDQTLL